MAQLTLTVIGDVSDVTNKISGVQKLVDNKPIKIKVETDGDAKALQAAARIETAKAKIVKSENDLKIAQEKTKQSMQNRLAAEQKLATQMEKTATAEEEVRKANTQLQQQIEKTRTEEAKLALQEEKTATAAENRATAETKATTATKNLGVQTEQTAKKTETLWDNFQKFARWYIIGNAFSGIVRSMKEALETMKAVDDELVTIRKVTGFSDLQIAGIKEQAYATASKYGVGAADYLESVAAFSRAGYKEQAAALAELSTKTQIVGDTTAEVANQFLLSVDAAYQYKGSIEELTRVLDGANEIDNKYATSIEKIAEGMGIVAPVAEQMHVGVNELAAAIGTITAVTQRSGSEAARALRALFLNIVGDTKTEIDEGVTWTTGEIAGLKDVIRQFAPEAYKLAEAEKTIIDPMEAIGGLAKSMQEGLLTEQKLMAMVSDIGGKLRTSQLLALIQNWDMYQSMLTDYAGAIGSADKEVENALDSWTRKTNQLKNAWTEFVSHLIDSGEIKAGIDLMIGFVKVLDSGVGKVAAFTLAIVGITAAMTKLIPTILELNAAIFASPLFIAGAATAVIAGIIMILDDLNATYEEHIQKVQELQTEYDRLYGEGGELAKLKSNIGDLTEEELKRLGVLESQRKELEAQISLEKQLAFDAWRKEQNVSYTTIDPQAGFDVRVEYNKTDRALQDAKKSLDELNNAMNQAPMTMSAYQQAIQKVVSSLHDQAEAIRAGKDAGKELTESEAELLALYDDLSYQIGQFTAETQTNTQAKEENAAATDGVTQANETLKTAFEEVEKNSSLTYGTLKQLDALYPGLSARIIDANGNLTAEGQAALSTKAAFFELISSMISANTTALNFDGQIAALQSLAAEAGIAAGMISMVLNSTAAGTGNWDEISEMTPDEYAQYRMRSSISQLSSTLRNQLKDQTVIGSGGGGGGGGGGSTTDSYLESLKSVVSYEKQRLSFLEASGASAADQAAQMRLIQDALHDQAEYLRGIEGESANVIALSTEWWNIQSKISKLLEDDTVSPLKEVVSLEKQRLSYLKASGATEEEQIAQMRAVQESLKRQEEEMRRIGADEKDILAVTTEWWSVENDINDLQEKIAQTLRDDIAQSLEDIVDSLQGARDAMLGPLEAELAALKEAHDAVQDRREEEEKILAVEKARIALENAQRERTVRQYNAATGAWEWVANAKTVESAQKALADAEDALAKYRENKEYEGQVADLESQISNVNSAFDALKDAIDEAAQAIKDGKMSYEEAYAYIKGKMRDIYNSYGVDLTGVLNTSITGLSSVNSKIRALLASLSAETQAAVNDAMAVIAAGEDAENGIALFTAYIQNALNTYDPEKAIKELSDAITNGIITDLNDVSSILKALNGDYAGISADTAKLWALTKMQANSIAWHMTEDAATQAALHAENVAIGTAIGLTYNSSAGTWHDASGKQVYTLNAVNGGYTSTLNGDYAGVSGAAGAGTGTGTGGGTAASGSWTPSNYLNTYNEPNVGSETYRTALGEKTTATYTVKANNGEDFTIKYSEFKQLIDNVLDQSAPLPEFGKKSGNYQYSVVYDSQGRKYLQVLGTAASNENFEARFFDTGGILHGMGGIKATAADEMVLPPSMTAGLLNAEKNGSFNALLNHLGIITSAANGFARNNIGTQHNGDTYEMNGVTISEGQARVMTVYDLAQMGRTLALHRGS